MSRTVIVDNAGGHLMQHSQVDLCITDTDRTTAAGDVCNKIGTYLKALAATTMACRSSLRCLDPRSGWTIEDGVRDVPIEERRGRVTVMTGKSETGEIVSVRIAPEGDAANYAFDVTPARLVSGLITERGGVCAASKDGMARLYRSSWSRLAANLGPSRSNLDSRATAVRTAMRYWLLDFNWLHTT